MTPRQLFWENVQKTSDCWLWTRGTSHGYAQVTWDITYKRKHQLPATNLAHRMAWFFANGSIPIGMMVCHRCDNPLCVRPAHLFLGSQRENLADMRRKNRGHNPPHLKGESLKQAKLTAAQVAEIRQRYADGESLRQLGRAFAVWYTTISMIVRRKTWTHIK